MSHIFDFVNGCNGHHVGFVACEIGVFLDGACHILKLCARLKFHVNHAAVDSCAERDGHRQGVLYPGLRFDAYGVSHAHAGAEVGVGDAFGGSGLKQGAHYGVAPRIPAGGDHGYGVVGFGYAVERCAELADIRVDVE